MGKWLTQLRTTASEKAQEGSDKSAKSTFCHFCHPVPGAFPTQKQDTSPSEEIPADGANGHPHLVQACDQLDLEATLASAQAAYEDGELSQEVVEDLAVRAAEKARSLPVAAIDIWSDELLDSQAEEVCFCCGQNRWWTDSHGVRKCGLCHPEPTRERSPRTVCNGYSNRRGRSVNCHTTPEEEA
jgi:hypothetical protein